MNPAAKKFVDFFECRPSEELYSVTDDPYELKNLALFGNGKNIKAKLVRYRKDLERWMNAQGDMDPIRSELEHTGHATVYGGVHPDQIAALALEQSEKEPCVLTEKDPPATCDASLAADRFTPRTRKPGVLRDDYNDNSSGGSSSGMSPVVRYTLVVGIMLGLVILGGLAYAVHRRYQKRRGNHYAISFSNNWQTIMVLPVELAYTDDTVSLNQTDVELESTPDTEATLEWDNDLNQLQGASHTAVAVDIPGNVCTSGIHHDEIVADFGLYSSPGGWFSSRHHSTANPVYEESTSVSHSEGRASGMDDVLHRGYPSIEKGDGVVAEPAVASGFGMYSRHGTRHGDLNQDVTFYEKVSTEYGDVVVAAVFDGHGILGETAAKAAAIALHAIIHTPSKMSTPSYDAEGWMESVFAQLQQSVEAAHRNPPKEYTYPGKPGSTAVAYTLEHVGGRFGMVYECHTDDRPAAPIDFGTTAALVIVVGKLITVGTLGDAGVIECSHDAGSPVGKRVTVPHTASEAAEILRIETDFEGKSFCTPDGYLAPLDDDLGQYEVQLTRSLGHVLLKEFGIIAVPEIKQIPVTGDGPFALVLCSDGITDELCQDEIASFVANSPDHATGCLTIVKQAQAVAMEKYKDRVDDCSAVVVAFQ